MWKINPLILGGAAWWLWTWRQRKQEAFTTQLPGTLGHRSRAPKGCSPEDVEANINAIREFHALSRCPVPPTQNIRLGQLADQNLEQSEPLYLAIKDRLRIWEEHAQSFHDPWPFNISEGRGASPPRGPSLRELCRRLEEKRAEAERIARLCRGNFERWRREQAAAQRKEARKEEQRRLWAIERGKAARYAGRSIGPGLGGHISPEELREAQIRS